MPKIKKSSASSLKKAASKSVHREGDREPGLSPPIPFSDPTMDHGSDSDDEIEQSLVDFRVKIDPSGQATKDNLTTKKFVEIKHLTANGNQVVNVYRQMVIDFFQPEGKMKMVHVSHRIYNFRRCMSGEALMQYNQALRDAQEEYANKVEYFDKKAATTLKNGDESSFFKYLTTTRLLTEDDVDNLQYTDNTWFSQTEIKNHVGDRKYRAAIEENIRDFERDLWFRLGELLWAPNHRASWKEQREYIGLKICKPYNWSMRDYISRVEVLADLLRYMQPPSNIEESSADADWKMRDDAMNKVQVRESILHGLPDELNSDAHKRCMDKDIKSVSDARFIDTLLNVEKEDLKKKLLTERQREKNKKRKAADLANTKPNEWSKKAKGKAKVATVVCNYCKNVLKKERWAYSSHTESECTFAKRAKMAEKGFGGNSKQSNKELKALKKANKKLAAKVIKQTKKQKEMMKFLKKKSKSKEFSAFSKKMNSFDDSDSDSDSSSSSSSSSDSDSE